MRYAKAMARRCSNDPDFRAQEQMRNAKAMAMVRQDQIVGHRNKLLY